MAKKFVHSISALLIIVYITPLAYCEESVHRQAPKIHAELSMNYYIDKNGDFWAWRNLRSFGLGRIDRPMKLESGIKSFSLGEKFSFLVKHDGTLWELRPKKGESGYTLHQVHLPNGAQVEEANVTTNNDASLIYDMDGNLWVSGQFFSKCNKTDQFKMRKFLSGIQKIKMRGSNALAVMESGELFTFGYNMCNELGTGSPKDSHVPVEVRIGGLDPKRIKDFSFGAGQSIAITDDGSLWSWGKSFDGEYYDSAGGAPRYLPAELEGTCTKEDRMPVKSAEWQNVKDIKTRFSSTNTYFVLQQDGKLWEWYPVTQERKCVFESIEAIGSINDRLLALQKNGTILILENYDQVTTFKMPPDTAQ